MEGGSGGGYLYVPILQWLGFDTEFKGDAIMLGYRGAYPEKIMILEVRFLLTNFDSSVIFKTLYLALNKLKMLGG